MTTAGDDLLTEAEAAELRRQSVRTLQAERVRGGGCPFVKLGRSVRYRAERCAGVHYHQHQGFYQRVTVAMNRSRIDFRRIADAAAAQADSIVLRWLPDGRRDGREWVARNPRRDDHRPGSFKVNLRSGAWSDFATGDKGGDLISLAAYLFGLNQVEAARRVADMLGIDVD